ncbi:MAG: 16S rRNA (uracil(1498)-N(3))-methyltransferase [Betaproteobacteria bacterium]
MSRIYFPGDVPQHGRCRLPPAAAHHLAHALRLAPGDAVTLFDGRGIEYAAVIVRVESGEVTLDVAHGRNVDRESPLAVTLAQGISSAERMDYTVQKAVELGVATIQPLQTHRGIVRLDRARALKRCAHWRAIAVAACEQCGRNRIPEVLPVMTLRDWLGQGTANEGELRILLSPDASLDLKALPRPHNGVTLVAGPEGGLSAEERRDAERAGFVALRIGPRILRTETAALAAVAAMQALWGDL